MAVQAPGFGERETSHLEDIAILTCFSRAHRLLTLPSCAHAQVVAVKAPGFGERKTSYLEDIAILTGGQMVKEELGISLDKATEEVLGVAAKVGVVGEGSSRGED